MKDKSRGRISSSTAMVAVIAVLVIVIASFAGSAYMKRDVALSQQRGKQERLETELITLQPSGFEPHEISRPQGANFHSRSPILHLRRFLIGSPGKVLLAEPGLLARTVHLEY